MKIEKRFFSTHWVYLLSIAIIFSACWTNGVPPSYAANDLLEAKKLVEESRRTLESFVTDPANEDFRKLLKQARGVYITPLMLKGAFVLGVSGGTGVFLVKDKDSGQWTGPAFYTVGGASFGFQAGGSASEVVLLVLTERGVYSMMANSVKLGADVGVAVGPLGGGASAATANLSADILSFTKSKGLYGGVSLEGAVVAVRPALNQAYYGKTASPTDILIKKMLTNPHAGILIEELTRAAGQK